MSFRPAVHGDGAHAAHYGVNQLSVLQLRALLFQRFGSALHFKHECDYLIETVAFGERVLDVEGVGIGAHGTGILAITERRIIHVKYRYFLRRFHSFICEYDRLNTVDIPYARKTWSQIDVHYDYGRRKSLMLLHPRDRAEELCRVITDAAHLPK